MLVSSIKEIGGNLLAARKRAGLTQAEVAEIAGLSDRAYADIERGVTNMRVETLVRICRALSITPDQVLTRESSCAVEREQLFALLQDCTARQQDTAEKLLLVYLRSLE